MEQTLVKIGENRLPNGKFAPGNCANPKGRPKNPEMEELRQAIRQARKSRGNKSILKHFVERAYDSDAVLIALIKKIIADKESKELLVDEGLREIFSQRVQINVIGVAPIGNQLPNSPEMSGSS